MQVYSQLQQQPGPEIGSATHGESSRGASSKTFATWLLQSSATAAVLEVLC